MRKYFIYIQLTVCGYCPLVLDYTHAVVLSPFANNLCDLISLVGCTVPQELQNIGQHVRRELLRHDSLC